MLRILLWLAGVNLLLIAGSLLVAGDNALISSQIAFFSSALVIGASSFSYSQMVYRRLADGNAIPDDGRDELDKLEDPYDLYSESTSVDNEATLDVKALKTAIKEERKHMKKNRRSLYQVFKDSRASLSFMRLGAYLILFLGFFYLGQNKFLHIPAYLIGLSLPIMIIVGLLMSKREEVV